MALKAKASDWFATARRETPKLIQNPKKRIWTIAIAIIIMGIAAYFIYNKVTAPPTPAVALQTTIARQGDLIISASGTGTLMPSTQINLGFGASGKITKLNVKVGDQVKQGDLLAELDNTSQAIQDQQAKRALAELTSPATIATAEQTVATDTSAVTNAQNYLEYLISPDIYYWEQRVAADQAALDQAKTAGGASPTDEQQKAIKAAQAKLDGDQKSLEGRQLWYTKSYVPNTFTVTQRNARTHAVTKTVQAPTDADIAAARAAYVGAQADLQEAQWYLDALNGKDIPDNATGADLTTYENAKLNVTSADAALASTQIFSPINGTVMSVSAQAGDTVGSTAIITVADLNTLYVQTYIDESDYEQFKVGNEADVVFDALPNQTFQGKVIEVDPALDTSSGSSVVSGIVQLGSVKNVSLLMGMSSSVEVISAQAQNAVLVSVNALHEYAPGKYSVFVMQNGQLTVRDVEVGLQDLVNAEIKSGLRPGKVVSTGIAQTTSQ